MEVNNLYEWVMSRKRELRTIGKYIKNSNGNSDEGYFLKVDVKYTGKLCDLRNDLTFPPERMKTEKLVASL